MTSLRWLFLLPITVCGVRSSVSESFSMGLASRTEKIEGKVIKCVVGTNLAFEQAEETSVLRASLEYVIGEDAGAPGWVIDIPGFLHFQVDSGKMMMAKMGLLFSPTSYTLFPSYEVDASGVEMQRQILEGGSSGNWFESFQITRLSDKTIKVIAGKKKVNKFKKDKYVEIQFTGAGPVPAIIEPRRHLPALGYYMPVQGNIVSLKVDGKTVYDQGVSHEKFPVVGTPSFSTPSGIKRGLSVNVVKFTHFWISKDEMEKNKHFGPNSHGFAVLSNSNDLVDEMLKGFLRWHHHTNDDGIDTSPELTIKNNVNSVEISGNGTELIFSNERVVGKVTKCSVNGNVVFEEAEQNSIFEASWENIVADGPGGITGWAITIPEIVRLYINTDSLLASDTPTMENSFVPRYTRIFPDKQIDERGRAMKNAFTEEGVDKVSIVWESHKKIIIQAQVTRGALVDIEFTRGPTTANAGDYDMVR